MNMKHYKFLFVVGLAVTVLSSCAEDFKSDFTASKPEDITLYEYLDKYEPLKTYIDRNAYPNFKLGAGVSVADFLKKDLVYSLICSNFDEVTAGNEMKYSSCVKNDGKMDFSQVQKLVAAAQSANISIHGHTLCWHAQQNNDYLNGLIAPTVIPGEEGDGGYCMILKNETAKANSWDSQTFFDLAAPLTQGVTYSFSCKAKATKDYTSSIFLQGGSQAYPGEFKIGKEWADMKITFTPGHGESNRIVFNFGTLAGKIYIDDVKLNVEGSNKYLIDNDFEDATLGGWKSWGGTTESISAQGEGYGSGNQEIEKTPEEKKEILLAALEAWIKGMMEACEGYVKSWDVVNEPLSDGNTDELKSDPDHTDIDNFYWQDYLGKDYARYAVKFARQHGGADLKLFINDYNLEATYNNNAKCVSLIKMIKYWESDGVTKIDGIGSQMHVSFNKDAEKQKKQEEAIVKMYELLAASGKLIKVTELDMGIVDTEGKAIKTVDLTYEEQLLMSDFYKFIVDKYYQIIPTNQQAGITLWSLTDSPDAEYSWRRGEPIGLWTQSYKRKPAYSGFADALQKR